MVTVNEPDEEDPPDEEATEAADAPEAPRTLGDLPYVGEATAAILTEEEIGVEDVREKRVSYRQLVETGVNPGVAGKLRREHSLHWTQDDTEFDLDRRSQGVRGLRDGEREWVAETAVGEDGGSEESSPTGTEREAPDTGDWTDADDWTPERSAAAESGGSGAGSNDPFSAEAAWRERARSPSVATIAAIPAPTVDRLQAAGVETVRQLANAEPDRLAAELGVARERVEGWRRAARTQAE